MYNGAGTAAWLLAFLFVLLGAALALFLICYGVLLIAQSAKPRRGGGWENTDGRGAFRRTAGARAAREEAGRRAAEPYGHAQRVGKHVGRGA